MKRKQLVGLFGRRLSEGDDGEERIGVDEEK